MSYCQQCGAKQPDNANFCSKCGAKLDSVAPQESAAIEVKPPESPSASPQEHTEKGRQSQLGILIFPLLIIGIGTMFWLAENVERFTAAPKTQSTSNKPGDGKPTPSSPHTYKLSVPKDCVYYYARPRNGELISIAWNGKCEDGVANGTGVLREKWRNGSVGYTVVTIRKGLFDSDELNQIDGRLWVRKWVLGSPEKTQWEVKGNKLVNFTDPKETKPWDTNHSHQALLKRAIDAATAKQQAAALKASQAAAISSAKPSAPVAAAPSYQQPSANPSSSATPGGAYKGNLYVLKMTITMGEGDQSVTWLTAIAQNQGIAKQMFDYFLSRENSGKRSLQWASYTTEMRECSGAGKGPYFAFAYEIFTGARHRVRVNEAAGWSCGQPSPDAAARAALSGCRTAGGGVCAARPGWDHAVMVSSHQAGGGPIVSDQGSVGKHVIHGIRNNYDYFMCVWNGGNIVMGPSFGNRGEPGTTGAATSIQLNCSSVL